MTKKELVEYFQEQAKLHGDASRKWPEGTHKNSELAGKANAYQDALEKAQQLEV